MLNYDIIILGLGVVTNYFRIPGMEDFSYSIKSFDAIKRFKEHLHTQIEDERRPDLNYVIVGAGPTGIELAGALPEYLRKVMDIHGVKHKAVYIDLIEAAPRLLPRMPQSASLSVARRLRRKGVNLYTDSTVQGVAADQLIVSGKSDQEPHRRMDRRYHQPSVLQKQRIHAHPARQKSLPTSTWRLTTMYLWSGIMPTRHIAGWRKIFMVRRVDCRRQWAC